MIVWTAVFRDIGARCMPVQLQVIRLGFFLVAFGRGTFGLFVCGLLLNYGRSETCFLSLDGTLLVKRSWFTLGARVGEVFTISVLHVIRVEALDVLPGIACLAVDRVSIIVREVTDTLDSVRLFLYGLDLLWNILDRDGIVCGEGSLTRSRNLRRQRWKLVGHNLTKSSRCELKREDLSVEIMIATWGA